MFGVLAVLVFFTWRSSKKRKEAAEQQKEALKPGVDIMTNFGLYGTVVSIDNVANIAEIEVSPGTVVRLHPGAIAKVITEADAVEPGAPRSVEEAIAIANAEEAAREAELAAKQEEPEFGERTEEPKKRAPRAKKSAE
jgi:preprotein translocase subunit YajC